MALGLFQRIVIAVAMVGGVASLGNHAQKHQPAMSHVRDVAVQPRLSQPSPAGEDDEALSDDQAAVLQTATKTIRDKGMIAKIRDCLESPEGKGQQQKWVSTYGYDAGSAYHRSPAEGQCLTVPGPNT